MGGSLDVDPPAAAGAGGVFSFTLALPAQPPQPAPTGTMPESTAASAAAGKTRLAGPAAAGSVARPLAAAGGFDFLGVGLDDDAPAVAAAAAGRRPAAGGAAAAAAGFGQRDFEALLMRPEPAAWGDVSRVREGGAGDMYVTT